MPNKYDKNNHKFVNTLKTNKSQELITNVIKKEEVTVQRFLLSELMT